MKFFRHVALFEEFEKGELGVPEHPLPHYGDIPREDEAWYDKKARERNGKYNRTDRAEVQVLGSMSDKEREEAHKIVEPRRVKDNAASMDRHIETSKSQYYNPELKDLISFLNSEASDEECFDKIKDFKLNMDDVINGTASELMKIIDRRPQLEELMRQNAVEKGIVPHRR